jgi:S1-C subfamily serine protease
MLNRGFRGNKRKNWSLFCIYNFDNLNSFKNIVDMKTKNFFSLLFVAILGGLISLTIYTQFVVKKNLVISAESPYYGKLTSLALDGDAINPVDFTFAAEMSIHFLVPVKTQSMQNGYSEVPFDFFFGYRLFEQKQQPVAGYGSGVIISNDGYIVTNRSY